MILEIFNKQRLLLSLAVVDFKEQFLGSYLGVVWAVLRPMMFIGVVWFIFSVGFKGGMIEADVPFVIYLLTGYIPWMFFSDAVGGMMGSIVGNKFLAKQAHFNVVMLPVVKLLSTFFLHIVFLGILGLVMAVYGLYPTIYWLQLPFYIFMLMLFLIGLGLITASLRVFAKDIAQFIGVVIQLGFWVTPIFWSLSYVPQKYMWLMNFNPMIYIIEGYRNTFISHIWFWENSSFLLSFIVYMFVSFGIGIMTFKKLRPHFGDVL